MTDTDAINHERCKVLRKELVDSCPICKGKGNNADGDICSCEVNFKNCVKMQYGGFPFDLQQLLNQEQEKFEELFNSIPVLNYFVEHPVDVREKGLSLYIYGELGVGKGLASLWAAKKHCASFGIGGTEKYKQHLMRFCFLMAVDFINNAKIFMNEPEKLEEIYSASFLVLDDFSNEYKKASNPDFVHRIYEKLFRDRLSKCLPTIVTTNIPPWKVAKKYDERIASLFGITGEEEETFQMTGRYASVLVKGTDFRKTDSAWSGLKT
jgi:hypothetical protein